MRLPLRAVRWLRACRRREHALGLQLEGGSGQWEICDRDPVKAYRWASSSSSPDWSIASSAPCWLPGGMLSAQRTAAGGHAEVREGALARATQEAFFVCAGETGRKVWCCLAVQTVGYWWPARAILRGHGRGLGFDCCTASPERSLGAGHRQNVVNRRVLCSWGVAGLSAHSFLRHGELPPASCHTRGRPNRRLGPRSQ